MSSFFSSRGMARLTTVVGIALIVALMLGVIACGEASIVGKWQDADGVVVELTSDGKMISGEESTAGLDITYKVDGDKLLITAMGFEIPVKYVLDGDTLQLEDPDTGEMESLKRVK